MDTGCHQLQYPLRKTLQEASSRRELEENQRGIGFSTGDVKACSSLSAYPARFRLIKGDNPHAQLNMERYGWLLPSVTYPAHLSPGLFCNLVHLQAAQSEILMSHLPPQLVAYQLWSRRVRTKNNTEVS